MHNNELHIDCKLPFKRNQVGHSKDTILLGVQQKSSQLLALLTCFQSQDDKNALVRNTPRRWGNSLQRTFSKNLVLNPLRSWAPSIQHPAKLSSLTCARIHLSLILIYAYMSKNFKAEAKDILFIKSLLSFPNLSTASLSRKGRRREYRFWRFVFKVNRSFIQTLIPNSAAHRMVCVCGRVGWRLLAFLRVS